MTHEDAVRLIGPDRDGERFDPGLSSSRNQFPLFIYGESPPLNYLFTERYPPELFHFHLNSVTGHSISALSAQTKGFDLIQVSAYLTGPITSPEDLHQEI